MPKTGGKKIAGLNQRTAIIVFLVVAVGVFAFLKYRSKGAAASQLSTASVPTDGTSAFPTPAADSTGGAAGNASGDQLAALLASFTTNPPYYYYNTGGNVTNTSTYNYGTNPTQPMTTSPLPPAGTTTAISPSIPWTQPGLFGPSGGNGSANLPGNTGIPIPGHARVE